MEPWQVFTYPRSTGVSWGAPYSTPLFVNCIGFGPLLWGFQMLHYCEVHIKLFCIKKWVNIIVSWHSKGYCSSDTARFVILLTAQVTSTVFASRPMCSFIYGRYLHYLLQKIKNINPFSLSKKQTLQDTIVLVYRNII